MIVAGVEFHGPVEVEVEGGQMKPSREPLALEVLKNWHKIPEIGTDYD